MDKQLGCTSHQVTKAARDALHSAMGKKTKVGHFGTLDPLASGILPLAFGTATKLLPYLPTIKRYLFSVKFGYVTDTLDMDGELIDKEKMHYVTGECISNILPQFTGDILQIPPMFSAKHVGGKRAYEIARSMSPEDFRTIQLEPCEVKVFSLKLVAFRADKEHPEVDLEMVCGPGTYVRSIARDLGLALGGPGATVTSLRRTLSGGFTEGEKTFGKPLKFHAKPVPMEKALAGIISNKIELRNEIELGYWRRKDAFASNAAALDGELCRVFYEGLFLGLGKCNGGSMKRHVHVAPV